MTPPPSPTVVVVRDADVLAEAVAARLLTRLVDADGPGVTAVELQVEEAPLRLHAQSGATAVLSREGRPDRVMPLESRDLGDLLAEELRRLDPDETYALALAAATGVDGLSGRPPTRTHVWHDPVESDDPDPALTTS